MVDISNIDKAKVLAALYNATHPQGLGLLHYDPTPMSETEARELLKSQTHFDYLKGRVMKVDLSGSEFDPRLYDRDNYDGAAQDAINKIGK